MSAAPLTHHEIIGLAEPFARRGRQVDLAASDRPARRLVFKPVAAAGLRETLELESLGTGSLRLTRRVSRDDGLQASVQALGADPATLLAQIEAVPLDRHFGQGPGWTLARSYAFDWIGAAGTPVAPCTLSRGELRMDGLTLTLELPRVRGVSADLSLRPRPGEALDLPEDLLAVLGWDWARLVREPAGWKSKLRLRGRPLQRSERAERALETAGAHLARVLAEAPARFHERLLWARWGVVLRRSIPSLTALGLLVGVAFLPRTTIANAPGLWVSLHYLPIGLLALAFGLQELPRFEIPPLPRRPGGAGWRRPLPAPAAAPPRESAPPRA
jgi:hypothetical protein